MINISHVDLVCARTVSSPGDSGLTEDARYYIELVGRFDDNETRKRPQVRCDNERIARRVTQKINYARNIFDEMTQAVIEANDDNENELWFIFSDLVNFKHLLEKWQFLNALVIQVTILRYLIDMDKIEQAIYDMIEL